MGNVKRRQLSLIEGGLVRVGRREWLVGMLGSGVLVACGSSSSGSHGGACAGFDAGPASSFAPGTWTKGGTSTNGFIVSQDAAGLFAYSTTCTHQGCEIGNPGPDGTATCPCHGARFDGNGNVLKGPAKLPLDHYAVTMCDGEVYVDTSTIVDASTRFAPT